jgi:hypothetical protein
LTGVFISSLLNPDRFD